MFSVNFSIDKSVMLLIDVQGRLAQLMDEKEKLFKSLQIMIQATKILEIPIVWMEQIPEKLGQTSVEISQFLPDQTPIAKSSNFALGLGSLGGPEARTMNLSTASSQNFKP